MKFLVRWTFRFFLVLVVLAVALVLLKDVLLKALAQYQIRTQTGMDAKIGALELGLFSPTLTLEDLKLYNAAAFGGSAFVDVPDLHVEYSLGALLRRKLHLPLVRLSLTEVNIVEARDGRTNLVIALNQLQTAAAPALPWAGLLGLRFTGIDILNLTLGEIKYTSLKHPDKVTELKLGVRNEMLTNVNSVADLTNRIMKTMFRNGITIVTESPAQRRRPPVPARDLSGSPEPRRNRRSVEPR